MQQLLTQGLKDLGLKVQPSVFISLLEYINLLVKWNRNYNLIATSTTQTIIERHIVDCLSVLGFVKGNNCLDIGTGAGLPGMVLAIAQPWKNWTLLDSNQKKLHFLRQVIIELNINNVELIHARVEDFTITTFDTLICRAFAPLDRLLAKAKHLLTKDNCLLAMKGNNFEVEVSCVTDSSFAIKSCPLIFPTNRLATTLLQVHRTC